MVVLSVIESFCTKIEIGNCYLDVISPVDVLKTISKYCSPVPLVIVPVKDGFVIVVDAASVIVISPVDIL